MSILQFRRRIADDAMAPWKESQTQALEKITRLNERISEKRRAKDTGNIAEVAPEIPRKLIDMRADKLRRFIAMCRGEVIKPETGEIEQRLYPKDDS